MKEKLDEWILAGLLQALQDPHHELFDSRLGPERPEPKAEGKAPNEPPNEPKAKRKAKGAPPVPPKDGNPPQPPPGPPAKAKGKAKGAAGGKATASAGGSPPTVPPPGDGKAVSLASLLAQARSSLGVTGGLDPEGSDDEDI